MKCRIISLIQWTIETVSSTFLGAYDVVRILHSPGKLPGCVYNEEVLSFKLVSQNLKQLFAMFALFSYKYN